MEEASKFAFVFPGQGSQAVGMGKDLADTFPVARKIFDRANDVLGFDLASLCFEGPEEELKKTVNAQPALLTTSTAVLAVLLECEPMPVYAAGHSVGEYAALVAAQAISFEQALKLVRRRGELMQQAAEAHPGTMAAVLGLSADKVKQVVKDCRQSGIVDAANFNTPEQIVISGEVEAVRQACEAALAAGAKRTVELNVSGAFHSRLMADAASAMEDELEKAEISDPKVPVVANVTADFVYTAGEIRQALAKQVAGSVRWEESVRRMISDGVTQFVELGSGTVLAGMIRKIDRNVSVVSVGDAASVRKYATKTES